MKRLVTAGLLAGALIITSVTFPKLDGSSKDPAYLSADVAAVDTAMHQDGQPG